MCEQRIARSNDTAKIEQNVSEAMIEMRRYISNCRAIMNELFTRRQRNQTIRFARLDENDMEVIRACSRREHTKLYPCHFHWSALCNNLTIAPHTCNILSRNVHRLVLDWSECLICYLGEMYSYGDSIVRLSSG